MARCIKCGIYYIPKKYASTIGCPSCVRKCVEKNKRKTAELIKRKKEQNRYEIMDFDS